MGLRFPEDFALRPAYMNILAYLTAPWRRGRAPRIKKQDLLGFLEFLLNIARHPEDRIVSNDLQWIPGIREEVAECIERLRNNSDSITSDDARGFVGDQAIGEIFSNLAPYFSSFSLYLLGIVPAYRDGQLNELDEFLYNWAASSRSNSLTLMIESPLEMNYSCFDPFPQTEAWLNALSRGSSVPGILLWSRTGNSIHLDLGGATRFLREFREVSIRPPERVLNLRSFDPLAYREFIDAQVDHRVEALIREFQGRAEPIGRRHNMVHLSDLHFGKKEATRNEAFLLRHLENRTSISGKPNAILVTGDLFDNPKEDDALRFRNFRYKLQDLAKDKRDPIVIPGNHDQKFLGNVGQSFKEVAGLEWSSVIVEDNLRTVFCCFDSSREIKALARGKVTSSQLMEVATELENQISKNADVQKYFHMALVHHHPFSFEVKPDTTIQRMLNFIGLSDENFMRMIDADKFLQWCAKRRIPLILHGHKHVQRHAFANIQTHGTEVQRIEAIGCGTSLGAENYPLSYNVISLDPISGSWSVSFYSSENDGSGFTQQNIVAHIAA